MIDEFQRIVKELNEDVKQALEKASKEVAKEGVTKLKQTSPKRSGKYAQGWRSNKQKDKIIINNKNKPGLTHLLEKGHAKRNGGRVSPVKHIEPVEELVQKELVKRIEKELG